MFVASDNDAYVLKKLIADWRAGRFFKSPDTAQDSVQDIQTRLLVMSTSIPSSTIWASGIGNPLQFTFTVASGSGFWTQPQTNTIWSTTVWAKSTTAVSVGSIVSVIREPYSGQFVVAGGFGGGSGSSGTACNCCFTSITDTFVTNVVCITNVIYATTRVVHYLNGTMTCGTNTGGFVSG